MGKACSSRITSLLASAALALCLSAALRADTVIPPVTLANQAGTSLPPLSSYTALGCVTVGAATSSVNLTATGGLLYDVTGTSQVLVQWQTGTGPWRNSLNLTGNGFLKKQGDLVRFVGNGSNTNTAWACVSYRTVYAEGTTVFSGPITVSGTGQITSAVPLTVGAFVNTAATSYMDKLTASGATADIGWASIVPNIGYLPQMGADVQSQLNLMQAATSTAAPFYANINSSVPLTISSMPGIDGATHQGFTWTQTPVVYNLTSTAGTSAKKLIVRMEGMPGPCAAASIEVDTSSSASAGFNSGWGAYVPLSTTGGIAYGPYYGTFYLKGRSLSSTNCMGQFVVETLP